MIVSADPGCSGKVFEILNGAKKGNSLGNCSAGELAEIMNGSTWKAIMTLGYSWTLSSKEREAVYSELTSPLPATRTELSRHAGKALGKIWNSKAGKIGEKLIGFFEKSAEGADATVASILRAGLKECQGYSNRFGWQQKQKCLANTLHHFGKHQWVSGPMLSELARDLTQVLHPSQVCESVASGVKDPLYKASFLLIRDILKRTNDKFHDRTARNVYDSMLNELAGSSGQKDPMLTVIDGLLQSELGTDEFYRGTDGRPNYHWEYSACVAEAALTSIAEHSTSPDMRALAFYANKKLDESLQKNDVYPLDILKLVTTLSAADVTRNAASVLLGNGESPDGAKASVQQDSEWVSIDGIRLPRKKLEKLGH